MTRLVAIAFLVGLVAGGAGAWWVRGSLIAREAAAAAEAAQDARERATRAEAQRLAVQAQRDALQRKLEDAAHAEPVHSPDALPASRVRRLQQIR
ncbi:hypothetical protein [Haematobacter missouriensis]|uniref:hypothetical protein n=1 Tax=Haematobacter missouriensis TaxID=366616 RepID=UPI0015C96A4D|nr:hypothetical protein [Haematobacter missouriensis]